MRDPRTAGTGDRLIAELCMLLLLSRPHSRRPALDAEPLTIFSAIICLLIATISPSQSNVCATPPMAARGISISAPAKTWAIARTNWRPGEGLRRPGWKNCATTPERTRTLLSGLIHERLPIARTPAGAGFPPPPDVARAPKCSTVLNRTPFSLTPSGAHLALSRAWRVGTPPKFEPLSRNDVVDDVLHDATFEAAATEATIHYQNSRRDQSGERRCRTVAQRGGEHRSQCCVLLWLGGKIDVSLEKANGAAVISVSPTMGPEFRKMLCHFSSSRSTGL